MRILLLTQWYEPEPTFKGALFARALQERGHEVLVLTGYPNYPGGKLYPGYRISGVTSHMVGGVRVIRVPLYPSHDSSVVRRFANYASFALSASVASLFVRRPDVVYVYHPPGSIGAAALALRYVRGVPFVYDIQDLWPDSLSATGMMSSPRLLRALDAWMRLVYRGAERVAVLAPGMATLLTQRGVPHGKVRVVYNWTYEGAIGGVDHRQASTSGSQEAADSGPLDDGTPFQVLYAGNVGSAQALDVIIDAARELRDTGENVVFDIMGDGIDLSRLTAAAAPFENIRFHPRRPPQEMNEALQGADALLVHLRDDPLFRITIPSKTQSSLISGRPVLMGVAGDAGDVVRHAKAGIVFPPGDGSALANAVRTMMALPVAQREAMGAAGRAYYDRHLSLSAGTQAFETLFEEAALERRPGDRLRRAVDVAGGLALGAVTALPLAVVATFVRARFGSPVLFSQDRPGRHGRVFRMYKFRTMTDERGADGLLLPDSQRLTPTGRWLRATSLDELPTLLNVIKGDMSFVGPRPLLCRYTPYFTAEENKRLAVRPGITGWAQVNGRNTAPWDERLAMDVWYVRHRSPALDLRILARTAGAVLTRQGVVVDPESIMKNLDDERASMSDPSRPCV